MGCGASITIASSPLEQAILQENIDQIKQLLGNPDVTSSIRRSSSSRDLEYSPGHVTSQCNSPLVIAARTSSIKVVYFLLKACPDIEPEIKREALMCCFQPDGLVKLDILGLLLRHGADVKSPLRLCQAFKAMGFYKSNIIHSVFNCFLNECTEENRNVVRGALLNSLCNRAVRVRARLHEEIGLEHLEWLLYRGVLPQTYWDSYFLDTCICDDQHRVLRPLSVSLLFARALTSPFKLRQLLTSAQLFTTPYEDIITLLVTLLMAGCFMYSSHRLTTVEKNQLLHQNPKDKELPEALELLDESIGTPSPLLYLACRKVRENFSPLHNPLSGTQVLKKQIYLPQHICDLLTLK